MQLSLLLSTVFSCYQLTWCNANKVNINLLKSIEHKISRSIAITYKLKPFLSKPALLKIYYAVIHPYLLYALPAWGSTYPTYMSKLCILQNKAIKLICDGKKSNRVTPNYSKLNTLKLQDFYKHEVAKMVFRFLRDNLRPTLQHLFSKTSEISFRYTRCSTNIYNLCIPRYTTTRLQKSIKYQGVKIWNKISPNLENKSNKNFNRCDKKFFINSYYTFILFIHPSKYIFILSHLHVFKLLKNIL